MCAFAFVLLADSVCAQQYLAKDLGTRGGDYSVAAAVNYSGQVTGVRQKIDLMIDRRTTLALALALNEPCTLNVQRLPGQLIERNTTRSLL